jgi:hypothetical protein
MMDISIQRVGSPMAFRGLMPPIDSKSVTAQFALRPGMDKGDLCVLSIWDPQEQAATVRVEEVRPSRVGTLTDVVLTLVGEFVPVNRRSHARHVVPSISARVRRAGTEFDVQLIDLSRGGCGFYSERPLCQDEVFEITLQSPTGRRSVSATAKNCTMSSLVKGYFRIGCQFREEHSFEREGWLKAS